MELVHGGDWAGYRAEFGRDALDFSANVSPLGLPAGVAAAITAALPMADRYPDPLCRALRTKLAAAEGVDTAQILCGNGAADLIYRLALALRPRRALLPAPTFAEYAAALETVDCDVQRFLLREEKDFAVTDGFVDAIDDSTDAVFLCQPNNPTGQVTPLVMVQKLLRRCADCGAVDETIKSSNPSFAYLDGILKRLHEQGNVRTEQDVSGDIEGSRKENEPIKQFLRALGNYSITINDTTKATYKSFQTMYPDPVILLAAQQCAKWGMTTLQDVMQTLMAWQNRSLRTLPEIDAYMRQIDEQNEFLIVLYQAMQLDEKTKPNAADRALVKQWTEEWRFAQMFVLGCAPWAAGKKSPMAYLNKMLKVFREKGITTMEAAKAERERFEQQPSQSTAPAARTPKVVGEQQYTQRTYTPTQDAMDAMMQEWEESHA